MDRRKFLGSLSALSAGAVPTVLHAQVGPPTVDPVEKDIPSKSPTIALNHLGFRPHVGRKVLLVRAVNKDQPREYTLRVVGSSNFHFTRELKLTQGDLGACLMADFSDFNRPTVYPAIYQINVGHEYSVPFFICEDVWRRTLPRSVGYYRYQRCGVDVPGVHPICHLDDARRRDNGEHVNVIGGWHDAGDLRKWMDPTMLNAIALLNLVRNIPNPQPGDVTHEYILDEVRHGNRYFLKMQDTDGRIWHDVAGGVNGDNSDNHWTDNIVGTADDRYINVTKLEHISAMFATLQAMVGQIYGPSDSAYARLCLRAGVRAWNGSARKGSTLDCAWWCMAACELFRATKQKEYHTAAISLGRRLMARQATTYLADQHQIRGYWTDYGKGPAGSASSTGVPYFSVVYPAMPAYALLELYDAFPDAEDRPRWKDAVRMHLDEFVIPLAERNPYHLIPSGLYLGRPSPETYRPLAGRLTYRYFMPVRKQWFWLGIDSNLENNALMAARFALITKDDPGGGKQYADLAYRQLEWVMGGNPFGACLMTGEGMRNPYPHSRFVGLIPGGIMNGIAGNAEDEPVLDQAYTFHWRTNEYWSPHVAYYLWSVSTLENFS
ncbi:MAG: glycoside hydrolase family 9 protein [Acidobacteria bacterium]|nr:glycoside hydrolase family 9 protein [Acidobacteriota bacterium]